MTAPISRSELHAFCFRKISLLFLGLAALLLFCACSSANGSGDKSVVRLRDGQQISFREMIGELRDADFVLVGEIHDSMASHRAELQVIKGLQQTGQPLAVGLEMFWAKSQPALDRWVQGKMDTPSFIRLYYRSWGLPWPYYRDILDYAKHHDIPLVGLNIPLAISDKVASEGFAALSEKERREVPPSTCDVTPGYRSYIRKVFKEHMQEQGKPFENFCEAQVLWDKTMAWHLVQYRKQHPGRRVVVLAGLVHALQRGIPSRIKEFSGAATTIRVIAAIPPDSVPGSIPPGQADYLLTE